VAGESQGAERNGVKVAIAFIVGLMVLALIGAGIWSLMAEGKSKKRNVVQQIAVLRPPPPPPPPKPEEKPPEPEIQKQEVKLPDPETPPTPRPQDALPSPDLGVDAAGTGNGDSFGLVGRPGGKDITTIGGGGGGGDRFRWYAGQVQGEIQKVLAKNNKLRGVEFKAVVKLWLAADGRLQRSELSGSSGNAETDELIKLALADMPPLRESPPSDMPQPIRLRITSRF
jgi:protein TonB